MNTQDEDNLINQVIDWAKSEVEIIGVALVGSHARCEANNLLHHTHHRPKASQCSYPNAVYKRSRIFGCKRPLYCPNCGTHWYSN